jgi:hypothetical protein
VFFTETQQRRSWLFRPHREDIYQLAIIALSRDAGPLIDWAWMRTFGVAAAYVFLGERLSLSQRVGAATILFSVLLLLIWEFFGRSQTLIYSSFSIL